MERKDVYTVSEVTLLLKKCLDAVPFFSSLSVKGEISNLKSYPFGSYFDLKDENSPLPCVYFASEAGYHGFRGRNGDAYVLEGRLSVYPKGGRYQFYVARAYPEGSGLLALKREELKKKLLAEGLFDESRKRPLPTFPRKIGILTAHPSAAEADILKNLSARYPLAELTVIPATVQGSKAPSSLVKGIKIADTLGLDLLIIARGGGSSEDLAAFDDEKVVRAIAASKTVTVTAIGHEVDFTLADFASDKRVSTPTAAAAQVVPDIREIKEVILEDYALIWSRAASKLEELKKKADLLMGRSYFLNPQSVYLIQRQKIEGLDERLDRAALGLINKKKQTVYSYAERLRALDPELVLGRGYALAYIDGKLVRDSQEATEGALMETKVANGIIKSRVTKEN